MWVRDRRRMATFMGSIVALTLMLAGCSAQETGVREEGGADIASLETAVPGEETAPVNELVAKYGEPVRLRLDMTDEEQMAAQAAYDNCVTGQSGADTSGDASTGGDAAVGVPEPEINAKLNEASEKCMVVYPLPPWEYDAENPDAVNFTQAIVDCLQRKGVTYAEVVEDGGRVSVAFGGDGNDSKSIFLGMQYYEACEAEVAAEGKWQN